MTFLTLKPNDVFDEDAVSPMRYKIILQKYLDVQFSQLYDQKKNKINKTPAIELRTSTMGTTAALNSSFLGFKFPKELNCVQIFLKLYNLKSQSNLDKNAMP